MSYHFIWPNFFLHKIDANENNMDVFLRGKTKILTVEVSKWYEQCYIKSFNRYRFIYFKKIQN